MKLINNSGADRVIDLIQPQLLPAHRLDCVTPLFSLFAFGRLRYALARLAPAGIDGMFHGCGCLTSQKLVLPVVQRRPAHT